MIDRREIREVLRAMAWSRAKGELRSILQTYYGNPNDGTLPPGHPTVIEGQDFSIVKRLVEEFVREVDLVI